MEQPKSKWEGLEAIAVVRQSNDNDGTASTAAQLDFMKKDLAQQGMRTVDAEVLEGVAASAPARINEVLEKLFKRKREKNDFDVIAWMVEDRASRGGGEHGMWMEHQAKRHGLRVYFPGDDYRAGPYAATVRVSKYEAARESSVGNGRRSTQGQEWAKKQGFYRTGGNTPIGCDRIYYGPDEQPKFTIRNLPSGMQEQYECASGRLIGTYGTAYGEGKKSRNRFKKQRNEFSLLVPGDRDQRRAVRVIFYLHHKRGWGGCRISDYLNRHRVPAPKGGEWSQRQVEIVYENESYTGVSTNNRSFSGRFFRRDRVLGFVALDRDECELVMKKSFAPKVRPMDDWDRIDQPHMYDFLPRDVRDLAVAALAELWRNRADPDYLPRKKTPRPSSGYLLSDRLRAVQDGQTLKGTLSGPRDRTIPYYRHPRSRKKQKGSIYNNLIPAKPLHDAIARVLAEVLADVPDLRERLTRHVIEQRAAALTDRPDVTALEAEREQLKAQITAIVRSLTGAALADAQQELERLGAQRNAVEAALAGAQRSHEKDVRPVEQLVAEALDILAADATALLTLTAGKPLGDLVDRLIPDATVDMASKAIELKVALPVWTLRPKPKTKRRRSKRGKPNAEAVDALCLPQSSRSRTGCQTQHVANSAPVGLKAQAWHELGPILALYRCRYLHTRGSRTPPCYVCRRAPTVEG